MLVAEKAVEIRVSRQQGKTFAGLRGCWQCRATRCDAIYGTQGCRTTRLKRGRVSSKLLRELRTLGDPGVVSVLKDHLATLKPVVQPE